MRTGATLGVVTASALDAAQPAGAASLPTPRAKALMALFGLKYPIFEACHGRATSPGTPRVRYGVRAIRGTGRRIRQGSARGGELVQRLWRECEAAHHATLERNLKR